MPPKHNPDDLPPPASLVTRQRQQVLEYARKSLTYNLFKVRWIPGTRKFVGVGQQANAQGCINIFSSSQGEILNDASKSLPKGVKCATMDHSPADGMSLAVGCFDGSLKIYDLSRLDAGATFDVQAHPEIINTIAGALYQGPPEIATGGRDGAIRVWDARQKGKPLVVLQSAQGAKRDCWAIAMGNSYNRKERMVAAGFDNGDIKMVDMRKNEVVWEACTGNGVCDLAFDVPDREMDHLYAACLEGRINIYDLQTRHPKEQYASKEHRVHNGTVWCISPVPQKPHVFATGGPGEFGLHKYVAPKERQITDKEGNKKGVLGGLEQLNNICLTTQPIASVDWCPSMLGLAAVATYDQSVRLVSVTNMEGL